MPPVHLPGPLTAVHAWTAVLDSMLSDGETLMTVAVGNNGERDVESALDRIQVPGYSVYALLIGAAEPQRRWRSRRAYDERAISLKGG